VVKGVPAGHGGRRTMGGYTNFLFCCKSGKSGNYSQFIHIFLASGQHFVKIVRVVNNCLGCGKNWLAPHPILLLTAIRQKIGSSPQERQSAQAG
jgi:hypothetical protein